MAIGKYSIVTSSSGNNYHYGDRVETGQFAFTAPEAGDFVMWLCFWADDHKPSVTFPVIDFDWRSGVAAKDWRNVAKKGQIYFMKLRKMEDVVRSVNDEMIHLREREEEMEGISRATNSKTAWLVFCSLFVFSSVAVLQLRHLKTSLR
ncbi:hypothetical protein MKX03_020261 [Papaver bracteatum]|nr:hypothetical protein MKX03_020261 [Papaver bracteatum]